VDNGSPTDLETLLKRFGELEEKIIRLESELARKDRIIAGLQQRLFGSSSEKLDPAQLQLLLDGLVLGKPAPPSGTKRRSIRTGGGETKRTKKPPHQG
jgi:uncharacterized coiled-coil protein SlyX